MEVKICGLTRPEDVAHGAAAGAHYLGFVFFPPSPRSLDLEAGRALMAAVPAGVARVALLVDAADDLLDQVAVLPVDILQLHGEETPERVAEVKSRTGLTVMKAVGIRESADLPQIARYGAVADRLLIDAKPPKGATRPGGNAIAFDWRLIAGRDWPCPWLLAGGLTPHNVAEAVGLTAAPGLDVSSGVEAAPGLKDPAKVEAFIKAANAAAPQPIPGAALAE
ncbi:MAG: phosphoribosylanthranilate isomerase [Pseudomonadota bacterium]